LSVPSRWQRRYRDLMDASENDTMVLMSFTSGRWYSFRVRVADDTIEVWIDDERVISVSVRGREVGLRPGEIEHSKPLGFASYRTVGALRNIEYRILPLRSDTAHVGMCRDESPHETGHPLHVGSCGGGCSRPAAAAATGANPLGDL
jgi:hypothetical protein